LETRSNKILVATAVAIALAALLAFSLWLTANRRSHGREYDVLLDRSVSGLLVGSPVSFSGVPVGRVMSVELDDVQPGRVRVRIDITQEDLPIVEGTVAHLDGDLLFGTALISLEGSKRGARPLLARAGEEVPVIPLEESGLGGFVNDPTPMVESISYATDRLLAATTPEEQRRLSAGLEALARSTATAAAEAPEMGRRIAPARAALRDGAANSAAYASQAAAARRNLEARGSAQMRDLRSSMAEARAAVKALDARLKAARPGIQAGSASLSGLPQKIREARAGVAAVTEASEQVESGGVGALLSGPPTPDYDPKRR
jgi:phospholipid/cholesterol/gamma-HCH transport system substrate-binding protein